MKDEKDIQREIEATLGMLDELHPVEPPVGLAERVMAGIAAEGRPVMRIQRRQNRMVWVAAAAAVVLAINAFTLIQWTRKPHSQGNLAQSGDAIEDIRTEYSLDNNLY